MYQVVDGNLCLSVADWIGAGLTRDQFKNDSKRGDLKIFRRSKHDNTLIDMWSIRRPERLAVIERAFGLRGERHNNAKHTGLTRDAEAFDYFRNYTYGEEETHLSPETIDKYTNNATIVRALLKRLEVIRAHRRIAMGEFWADSTAFAIEQQTKGFPNSLPESERGFERLVKRYLKEGLSAFISKNYGNEAAIRLEEEAKEWLIARYATPINKLTMKQLWREYNAVAPGYGWKTVKAENTIRRFLNRPEVRPLWYAMRHGELKAKELFTRQNKTILPQMRDALWYGDGTKLNYYYLNDEGKMDTCCVYEVMDVYSEVLLGFYISKKEDFESQYFAYKMAMQFSGHKPYEIRFDNQGGHGKLKNGRFFKDMARLAISTQPYNGKSKTIESAFGRFQADFLHRDWFFTGMNVKTKKEESRANMEFILANQKNLKTLDEIKAIYEARRREWNEAEHPGTGRRRIDMYRESVNEKSKKITAQDMFSLFGILDNKDSCKYTAGGLKKTIKGQKYTWEVLTADGQPDLDFLRKNVGRDFFVEYDPTDMSVVALYIKDASGELRFVTLAKKYIEIHRAKQEQDELDSKFLKRMELQNKGQRVEMFEETERLLEKFGMHPSQHGLNMPKLRGVERDVRERKKKVDIGTVLKDESNMLQSIDGDYDLLDNY